MAGCSEKGQHLVAVHWLLFVMGKFSCSAGVCPWHSAMNELR